MASDIVILAVGAVWRMNGIAGIVLTDIIEIWRIFVWFSFDFLSCFWLLFIRRRRRLSRWQWYFIFLQIIIDLNLTIFTNFVQLVIVSYASSFCFWTSMCLFLPLVSFFVTLPFVCFLSSFLDYGVVHFFSSAQLFVPLVHELQIQPCSFSLLH